MLEAMEFDMNTQSFHPVLYKTQFLYSLYHQTSYVKYIMKQDL